MLPGLPRHFLTGQELSEAELDALLHRALELKRNPRASRALEGRSVALIFEAPSTRTRVSFEVGVFELGGHPLILRPDEMQISRGESIGDVARVLSRHVAVDRAAHRRRGPPRGARRARLGARREHALAGATIRARRSPTW